VAHNTSHQRSKIDHQECHRTSGCVLVRCSFHIARALRYSMAIHSIPRIHQRDLLSKVDHAYSTSEGALAPVLPSTYTTDVCVLSENNFATGHPSCPSSFGIIIVETMSSSVKEDWACGTSMSVHRAGFRLM
jgi:hypothetical protein